MSDHFAISKRTMVRASFATVFIAASAVVAITSNIVGFQNKVSGDSQRIDDLTARQQNTDQIMNQLLLKVERIDTNVTDTRTDVTDIKRRLGE